MFRLWTVQQAIPVLVVPSGPVMRFPGTKPASARNPTGMFRYFLAPIENGELKSSEI